MADTLKLEIVTPQATVFSEDVHMVTLPGDRGADRGLSAARPLMTQIVPGEIIVTRDGQDGFSRSAKGSWKSPRDRVAIVTDMAIPADKIDEAKVEEARATRRSPAPREDLGRGSRLGQRLARAVAGATASQAAPAEL